MAFQPELRASCCAVAPFELEVACGNEPSVPHADVGVVGSAPRRRRSGSSSWRGRASVVRRPVIAVPDIPHGRRRPRRSTASGWRRLEERSESGPRRRRACESLFPAKTYTIPVFERATACGRTPTGAPSLILWRAMTRRTTGGAALAGCPPLVRSGAWKRRTGTARARSLLRAAAGARAPGRGVPPAKDVTVRAMTRSDRRRPSSRSDVTGGRSGHGRRRGGDD